MQACYCESDGKIVKLCSPCQEAIRGLVGRQEEMTKKGEPQ